MNSALVRKGKMGWEMEVNKAKPKQLKTTVQVKSAVPSKLKEMGGYSLL